MNERTGLTVEETAAAKINLALHVTGQRSDGYHLIDTLVTFAAFGDRLSFALAENDAFVVSGPFAEGLPVDDDPATGNLVLKARNALRQIARDCGVDAPAAKIHLEKHLPPSSGIGGGSADAAATLRGLQRLWHFDCPADALQQCAVKLGADVPMCLSGKPLVAQGIGDEIAPVDRFPSLALVLVNPLVQVSTPAIFKALANKNNGPILQQERPSSPGQWFALIEESRNDLSDPARQVAREIDDVIDAIARTDAMITRMSGSGATCFGIYRDFSAALNAARQIQINRPGWFVRATQTSA